MTNSNLNLLKESGAGKLYESNGFLVPVLTGSSKEMTDRAHSTFSTRNRLFYGGVAEATGWPLCK